MIEVMRCEAYPSGELIIARTLEPGENYGCHIASYLVFNSKYRGHSNAGKLKV